MFVSIDDDICLAALDRESHDLICKTAGALRGFGLVLRCDSELVLFITESCHCRAMFSAVMPMW